MALAFSKYPWVSAVVSTGAVLATATGSLSGLLMTSRIVYSMAQDGILHPSLAKVTTKQIPWVSIVVSMVLPALGILLLDIEELVMMNSGGLLICFCLTNICVIVGRYQGENSAAMGRYTFKEKYSNMMAMLFWLTSLASCFCFSVIGFDKLGISSGLFFLALSCVTLCLIKHFFEEETKNGAPMTSFKCPLVPWLPGLGVYVNSALMVSLPWMTWVRVLVCLGLGLCMYAMYGLQNSSVTRARSDGLELESADGAEMESSLVERDSYSDTDKLVGNEL